MIIFRALVTEPIAYKNTFVATLTKLKSTAVVILQVHNIKYVSDAHVNTFSHAYQSTARQLPAPALWRYGGDGRVGRVASLGH